MNERPTNDELEDPAETGRRGCLIPETDNDDGHCDAAGEDEE